MQSYNPDIAVTISVWASPRSLATTCGITFVFFSYGYLDVSVPHVRLLSNRILQLHWKSTDQYRCAVPRSLSQLITSFLASETLDIPHTLLLSSLK
jgi:hypothetical protein